MHVSPPETAGGAERGTRARSRVRGRVDGSAWKPGVRAVANSSKFPFRWRIPIEDDEADAFERFDGGVGRDGVVEGRAAGLGRTGCRRERAGA